MFALILTISFCTQCRYGVAWFQMLSRGKVVIASVGETVRLECDFYTNQFNLFDNPLLWEKTQFTSSAVHMNMMGKILEPFASTKRFETKLTQDSPKYSLRLTITDASPEDNGNYTCVVNGPENSRRGITQHALIVTAPVDNMSVALLDETNTTKGSKDNSSDTSDHFPTIHLKTVTFTETDRRRLRCVTYGGYPPPDVTVHLGNRDVTGHFQLMRTNTLIGAVGLQLKYYVTERVMRDDRHFRFGPEDDGEQLRCVATTKDVATNHCATRIVVHYAPKIQCQPKTLTLNEVNVFLRCEVRSRPKPSITWIIDDNGSTVTEDQERNGCYVIVTEQKRHLLEVQLIVRKVTIDKFRDYELLAENSIGTTRHRVSLKQKIPPVARPSISASRQEKSDRRFTPSPGVVSRQTISLIVACLSASALSGVT